MEKLRKRTLNLINTDKRINKAHNDTNKKANNQNDHNSIDALINYLTKTIFYKQENRLDFVLGLIQEDFVIKLRDFLGKGRTSSTRAHSLLCKTSVTFQKNFQKITWNTRCNITVETDKILGISSKIKRSPGQAHKGNGKKIQRKTRSPNKKSKPNAEQIKDDPKIKEILYNFIERGTKWLGLR